MCVCCHLVVDYPMNVCFAFHSSTSSTTSSDFLALKSFIKLLVDQQAPNSFFSLVSFGGSVNTEVGFNSQQTLQGLFNAIDAINQQTSAGADAAAAINLCSSLLPVGSSSLASIIFFITDVPASNQAALRTAASSFTTAGGLLTYIAVGNGVNPTDLQQLVSTLFLANYSVPSYSALFNIPGFFNNFIDSTSLTGYPFMGEFCVLFNKKKLRSYTVVFNELCTFVNFIFCKTDYVVACFV